MPYLWEARERRFQPAIDQSRNNIETSGAGAYVLSCDIEMVQKELKRVYDTRDAWIAANKANGKDTADIIHKHPEADRLNNAVYVDYRCGLIRDY